MVAVAVVKVPLEVVEVVVEMEVVKVVILVVNLCLPKSSFVKEMEKLVEL